MPEAISATGSGYPGHAAIAVRKSQDCGGAPCGVPAPIIFAMQALLECRPILHSRDIEETRAFRAARAIHLELLGSIRPVPRRLRRAFTTGSTFTDMWLGYIRYGARVAARVSPSRGDYWVHLPLHGRIEVVAGWDSLDCDPSARAVTSPFDTQVLKSDPESARLSLSVHGDALRAISRRCSMTRRAEPLHLARARSSFDGALVAASRGCCHAVARDFCRSGLLANPLAANDFEQFVMTSLLLSLSHNYSGCASPAGEPSRAARRAQRASEYIRERAGEPGFALADPHVSASRCRGADLAAAFPRFLRRIADALPAQSPPAAGARRAGRRDHAGRSASRLALGLRAPRALRRRVPQALRRVPFGYAHAGARDGGGHGAGRLTPIVR